MYKILISGYYGAGNIGDESILRAVVDNLREKLSDIEITVLSKSPEYTSEKYAVRSAPRKDILAVIREIRRCDLLISGGGSLLQDVTSKKSIIYYLAVMWLARLFGKKFFIYSQGIGPINSNFNRGLTRKILMKASGIVVRDISSKEFLTELGIPAERVVVTADPVLRIKRADTATGREILASEGFARREGSTTVGFAIKEKKTESGFVDELCTSMEHLLERGDVQIVLIPFHFNEDMAVAGVIEQRLTEKGYGDKICTLRHKYLTEEMLSIIGNMDVLVGVRLHSLIHAAIMGVPMIGISYDPKINSFMKSIGMKAMCMIYDFSSEDFLEEFDKTMREKELIVARVNTKLSGLVESLDTNEELIKALMDKK